jgi:hypothetical protein
MPMSTLHDIYNPPPAPVPFTPETPEPIRWSVGDLLCLLVLCMPLFALAAWASSFEPSLWPLVVLGGGFVVVESWLSALSFLHRHPAERGATRWMIFLAALVPWLLGLGLATALILGLFTATDWMWGR